MFPELCESLRGNRHEEKTENDRSGRAFGHEHPEFSRKYFRENEIIKPPLPATGNARKALQNKGFRASGSQNLW